MAFFSPFEGESRRRRQGVKLFHDMTFFFLIAALAIVQGLASLLDGVRAAGHIRSFRPRSARRPRVVVLCPCKGIDDEFEKNVKSILDQDYPDFRVIFVVESADDPAFAVLQSLGATVLAAGAATDRGQKVHNLIHAVENASGGADVLAFCDADARFPRHWLRDLAAPLDASGVGVATGYRWYAPEPRSLPSLARSIWNASVVTALGDHGRNFAWGGSMALRRDVFERIGVRSAWDGTVSDDYAVTRAVRAAGLKIVFVPTCLVPSYGRCTWRELLEFTTRQIVITRIYEPGMWRMALWSHTIFNAAFWSSAILAPSRLDAAAAWVVIYGLSTVKAWIRLRAVACVVPATALSKHRWFYILGAPLAALLFEYNLIRSAFTRDIVWRGIRYKLLSPRRTVVERR